MDLLVSCMREVLQVPLVVVVARCSEADTSTSIILIFDLS